MPSRGRFLLLSLIVGLLAGLPFAPGLSGGFVFDDLPNIVDNPAIQLKRLDAESLVNVMAGGQVSGITRALPTLTFALDFWRADGMDPAAFKATNILIHAVTACALAWFFHVLLQLAGIAANRSRWLAAALALAWAVHPLQVSSVLYVVQRLQTMSTLFLVLALLAYLHARRAQIEGSSGRTGLLATALLWVLALGCKEDAALLPAYMLALELSVLRFAAADSRAASHLRRGYLIASLAGAAAYLLLVVPHYWQWDSYPGRDFSTPERLLTQARVLCLYLWQIVMPLPQHMAFYYDGLQPSRGLLQPWTTLPSLLLVAALLVMAWWQRTRRPLIALGIFLFFGAHFIASNVLGLELAFEHRNHFALIGAVLSIGGLLAQAGQRLALRPVVQASLCLVLLVALASATLLRANTWGNALGFARASTELAPDSARAWVFLCVGYLDAGGGAVPGNPHLDEAIKACDTGTASAPYGLNNPTMLVILKSLRGDVTAQDWDRFQQRLRTARMSIDNRRVPMILSQYARQGVKLDKQELLEAMDTLVRRAPLEPFDTAAIGYFIMNDLAEPDLAMPYFVRVINAVPPGNPFPRQLGAELRAKGRQDLATAIEQMDSVTRDTGATRGR